MLTKLSEAPDKLNGEITARMTSKSLGLHGYTIAVVNGADGTVNYDAANNAEPVSISERAEIGAFHVLDNSDTETDGFGRDVLTYAMVCFSTVAGFDEFVKGLLKELAPGFKYVGADYNISSILSSYNIKDSFNNWEKFQLFVIRYQVRVPVQPLSCIDLC